MARPRGPGIEVPGLAPRQPHPACFENRAAKDRIFRRIRRDSEAGDGEETQGDPHKQEPPWEEPPIPRHPCHRSGRWFSRGERVLISFVSWRTIAVPGAGKDL